MAPLPKRKHSKKRSGTRKSSRAVKFPALVTCPNCKKKKLPHRPCKHCGK